MTTRRERERNEASEAKREGSGVTKEFKGTDHVWGRECVEIINNKTYRRVVQMINGLKIKCDCISMRRGQNKLLKALGSYFKTGI